MKVLFCGTAAAEAWPALFCTCKYCDQARVSGGKDIRSRAAYMVNDSVRVDFGPDSNYHHHKYGLAYERLEHLLISHSHDDHWDPRDLMYRRRGYSVVPEAPLPVWGNERIRQRFEQDHADTWRELNLEFRLVANWDRIALGNGLSTVAVPAAHDPGEQCFNYLLDDGSHRMLIAHDTGWYPEETWERLREFPLDCVAFDCTYGPLEERGRHLGCHAVVDAQVEMYRRGVLSPTSRVIATHFSHNGGWLHDDLARFFSAYDIEVAYDGLIVEL